MITVTIEAVNGGYYVEFIDDKTVNKTVFSSTKELNMFDKVSKFFTHKTLKDLEKEKING